MSASIIPGDRTITADEMRLIRDMHAAGRSLDDIADVVPGIAATHTDAVNRLASMLSPPRRAPKKTWHGRGRR